MIEQSSYDQRAMEKRLDRSEREISQLANLVTEQGRQVSSAVTAIEQVIDQVGALSNRTNQPVQWGSILTAIGLLVMMMTLAFAPLITNQVEMKTGMLRTTEFRIIDARETGAMQSDIEWLKKLEERNYELHDLNGSIH